MITLTQPLATLSTDFKPRDYQRKAVNDVKQVLWGNSGGQFSTMLVASCGAGKTNMAGLIIKESGILERGGKILFLCHKVEPIKQAIVCLRRDFNILAGKYKPKQIDCFQVYVGTVQEYQNKRLSDGVELIILDECHTVSYHKQTKVILNHYLDPVWALTPTVKVLGLTATPIRNDYHKEGFCWLFRSVVRTPPIEYLQQQGHLAHDRLFGWSGLIDYAQLKITKDDDFSTKSIDKVCDDRFFKICVKTYLETCPDRRGIFFCSSIERSIRLAEIFTENGVPAAAITGKHDHKTRDRLLEELGKGELRIITNPFVFAEGMDTPFAECVGFCRPVRSPAQLIQMAGRGTRLCTRRNPNKKDTWILDFTGSFGETSKRLAKDLGIVDFRLGGQFPIVLCPKSIQEIKEPFASEKKCPGCGKMNNIFTRVCKCGHVFSNKEKQSEISEISEVPDFGEYIDPTVRGLVAKLRGELKEAYEERKNPVPLVIAYKTNNLKGVYIRDEWLTGCIYKYQSNALIKDYESYLQETIPNITASTVRHWIKREFGRLPEPLPWREIFGVRANAKLHEVGKAYLQLCQHYGKRQKMRELFDEALNQAQLELRYKQHD